MVNGGFEGPKLEPKSIKIGSRRYLKQDKILDRFWMALESIFGRFWRPSWEQVGTKIDPKVRWKRCWKIIKKNDRKKVTRAMQGHASNGGGAPYKSTSRPSRELQWNLYHSIRALKARWRIYIYIYIYIIKKNIYIYAYIHIYIYIHTSIYVYIYLYMSYIRMYENT